MVPINQAYLKSILNYEPMTGIFRWKIIKTGWRGSIIACPGDRAGHAKRDGYWGVVIDGKHLLAHRVAWLWMTGNWPEMAIDHIDRNKGNNRWSNLREATPSQNSLNCRHRTREELAQARLEKLAARAKVDSTPEWVLYTLPRRSGRFGH